jgi:hypothetical protein
MEKIEIERGWRYEKTLCFINQSIINTSYIIHDSNQLTASAEPRENPSFGSYYRIEIEPQKRSRWQRSWSDPSSRFTQKGYYWSYKEMIDKFRDMRNNLL